MRRASLTKTRLYLHLSLADLLALPDQAVTVGEVERLGPATLAKIREWLAGTRATVVPVLDLAREGTYTWHGPHTRTYLVTPLGTQPLPRA